MRPTLTILQEDLIQQIMNEAKRILSEIGVEVRGTKMRQRLLDYGLMANPDDGRILFPPDVVDAAISDTPRSFTLYDRDGRRHAEIGADNVHFTPGSSGLKVLDHRTGLTRLATTADFVEYVHLADGLPNIAYLVLS